ncbi:MAG TPA: DUF6520 family protein [Arachidicoccus sp.]|nr:DUF6520 family protein [Arachidicoccus sp.]
MRKIKILLPFIAVLLAVAGVFAMKAHKTNVDQKLDTYYYIYEQDSKDLNLYQDAANWTQTVNPANESCPIGGSVPCVVHSDQSTVQDFVNSIQSTADVESNTYATKP